jgi:hypothetical protein
VQLGFGAFFAYGALRMALEAKREMTAASERQQREDRQDQQQPGRTQQ